MPKIGVLAIQGDYQEHKNMLEKVGACTVEVRLPHELKDLEEMVIDKMIKALPLSVPIEVDSGYGQSWYEAH